MDEKTEIHHQLAESGIGRRYFSQTLADHGETGKLFSEKLGQPEWLDLTLAGRGINFHGPASYDLAVMVVRGLVLKQYTAQVVTLAGLVRALEDYSFAKQLTSQDVLLVTRFCNDKCPLALHQRLQIEDLLQERWDDHLPVLVQTEAPLGSYKDWWTAPIVAQLLTDNETVDVK